MVHMLKGEQFFEPDFPVFLNQETESFQLKFHTHDFVEINLVQQGAGFQFIDGQSIPVQKGDLFVLPIGTSHVFRPTSPNASDPLIISNCIFKLEVLLEVEHWIPRPSLLHQILYNPEALPQKWFYTRDRHHRFEQLFQAAYLEYSGRNSDYRTMLKAILLQLLLLLHRSQLGELDSALAPISPPRARIDELLQYIDEHPHERLTLATLAESSYMSVSRFQQLFKERTGKSLNAYLQHLRIQKSCEWLVTTHLNINEIASRVGYADMKFFHKLFRKITGVTPRQYRLHHHAPALREINPPQ